MYLDPHLHLPSSFSKTLSQTFSQTEQRGGGGERVWGAACGNEAAAPVQSHAAPTKAPACPHLCGHFLVTGGVGWGEGGVKSQAALLLCCFSSGKHRQQKRDGFLLFSRANLRDTRA